MTFESGWLLDICRQTDELLLDSYAMSTGVPIGDAPSLVFPKRQPDRPDRRVSEQEARFAFTTVLARHSDSGIGFAVEAPTEFKYRFAHRDTDEAEASDPRCRRARVDLVLYSLPNVDQPALAIEFKASGHSEHANTTEALDKDVVKLIAERPDGLWYHLCEDANRDTLPSIVRVLGNAVRKFSTSTELKKWTDRQDLDVRPRAKRLSFHLLVLKRRLALHGVLEYVPESDASGFFEIQTPQTGSGPQLVPHPGWEQVVL